MKLTPLGKFLQGQDTKRVCLCKQLRGLLSSQVCADLYVTGCCRIDGLASLTVKRRKIHSVDNALYQNK